MIMYLNHLKSNSGQRLNIEESGVELPGRFQPFDGGVAAQLGRSREEMRSRAISRRTLANSQMFMKMTAPPRTYLTAKCGEETILACDWVVGRPAV